MIADPDILGHTDQEIARHRNAQTRSRAALDHVWRILICFDDEVEFGCRLYDAIERSSAAQARQIVLDWVRGGQLIALTDCPLAFLKMEGSRLGICNLPRMLLEEEDALDDYRADIDALERGENAPDAISPGWR